MYLSESSPFNLRGAISVMNQLGVTVGILLSQVLGLPVLLGKLQTRVQSQFHKAAKQKTLLDTFLCYAKIEWGTSHKQCKINVIVAGNLLLLLISNCLCLLCAY